MIDQVNATYDHELVKRMIEEAVLAEREACAAICDELHKARVGKDNYFAFAANVIRELRAKQ
jgi:hypothetical protein